MQGATAVKAPVEQEAQTVPTQREADNKTEDALFSKGFKLLGAVCLSLLVSFGGWLIISVNQINRSTAILETEVTAYKPALLELKGAVDDLRLKGENWATKDSLTLTKDSFRDEVGKIKDQINLLELRLTRMESQPPAPLRR